MVINMKSSWSFIFFGVLILWLPHQHVYAEETSSVDTENKKSFLTRFFKDKEIDVFPVPVFETRPDEGQSYGLMPVLLLSEKDSKAIETIIAAMGQWNEVVKFSGALVFYHFLNPTTKPDQQVQIYFEWGQKYYREVYTRYFDPEFLDHFYLDAGFTWLKTPFRRFYGYGAASTEGAESNFVSNNITGQLSFGYYFLKDLRLTLTETITSTDLQNQAITDVADTLASFGGVSGVEDDFNFIHRLALTYDSRPNGLNSKKGTVFEAAFFISDDAVVSDHSFRGYSFEAVQLFSYLDERMTTAARAYIQDIYGSNTPFYLQSALGGDRELRSFIPNRFVDTGKVLFSLEQRMRVLQKTVFGITTELWADPFLEIGRVFNHINHLGCDDYQVVGGLGLRFIVPPNVTARVDFAIGSEGYNVYTQLGYPF